MQDDAIREDAIDALSGPSETRTAVSGSKPLTPTQQRVQDRADAVHRIFHAALQAGEPLPTNRDLADRLLCSLGAIGASIVKLIREKKIRSVSYCKPGSIGMHRSIEILIAPLPASDPDLPPDTLPGESAGGPRVVPAPDPQVVDMRTPKTAAEPVPVPPLLSLTDRRTPRGTYTGMTSAPISIERARLKKLLGSPKTYALKTSDGCQFPEWPDGAGYGHPKFGVLCGADRCHEGSPYCAAHHGRAFTGILKHHAALSPEERAERIAHGKRVKEGQAKAKERRKQSAQQGA